MECQPSDSKKLFKVFDASKRHRTRKKREDDSNSMATDESNGGCQNGRRVTSAKASLQDISPAQDSNEQEVNLCKRERDSSPSVSRSPVEAHRPSRSPRRHRRIAREGLSLALKAGLVSTPRSMSPRQEGDDGIDSVPQDQDSFIYAFLEEAIKRDKKKHRHSRRHEERAGRDRDASSRDRHHHHHRRRHRDEIRERDKKEESPVMNQGALFETFAKLCAQMNEKSAHYATINQVPRTLSHKSLQCEVVSKRDSFEVDHRPVRLHSREHSRDNISPSRIRSHEHFRTRVQTYEKTPVDDRKEKCCCTYDKQHPRYCSKVDLPVKHHEEDRYRVYPPEVNPTRSCIGGYNKSRGVEQRDLREFDDQRDCRKYEDRRRMCDQKTSRSFDIHREGYIDYDKNYRRTARSDGIKDKSMDDRDYRQRRYDDRVGRDKYYYEKDYRERNLALAGKDRRSRRNLERFERTSIASRDEDYRDRDRYSERERDSGLSVADGETSTMSGRSNYLRVVKQEISEQREAMDKMMKLWKELMRCFKGVSQPQGQDKAAECAANVRESAAAQLRLWRECMRRYETVARDVGDTDARLMEEINKQRSEMSEMASMWQECLQRYRDMSNDFNSLKQQLATSESPSRMAAPPLVCAEGEGPPAAPYRLPNYPPMGPLPPGYAGGSPLRPRASAPPAWWWGGEGPQSPRRRSSPDSRGSRERRHRHKDRDREDSRYKEKSSKPSGARSEHRHRKR